MSNALVIHCRNPSEFIASVVERYRGFQLPKSEDEKTYLAFIGLEGENELLKLITGKDLDFFEISRGDLEVCGRHGGKETVKGPVQATEDGEEVEISSRRPGIRSFPRQMGVRVPLADGMDKRYHKQGEFCVSNLEREVGSETFEGVQGPSPIPQFQQGRNGGIRRVGSLGLRYYTTDEEKDVGEIAGEQLVAWHSRLPLNLLGGLDEIGDEENEQTANGKHEAAVDKHVANEGLIPRFLQFRDRSVEMPGGHIVINNSQKHSDKASQQQPDKFIVGERAIFPAASEEFPQSTELHRLTLQGKTGSPILDGVSCPNWFPSFGSESAGDPGEVAKGEDGWHGEQKVWNKFTGDLWVGDQVAMLGEREDIESQRENKVSLKAPQLDLQSIPQVQEPVSLIPPQRDAISLPDLPSYLSPNRNTDEAKSMQLEGEAETPAYPAKTLENLISMEYVDIVYLEDLETLHGFLEAMMYSPAASTPNPPILAIWGLVGAHYRTKYFGGEGIGETVARAVETTAKSGRFLVLGEGCIEGDYADREDEVQEKWWVDLEVPILNVGSMNVGRTVIVGQILRRWCRFGEDLEDAGEDGGHGNDDNDNRNVNAVLRV